LKDIFNLEIHFPYPFSVKIDDEGGVSLIFGRDGDINPSFFDELDQRITCLDVIV